MQETAALQKTSKSEVANSFYSQQEIEAINVFNAQLSNLCVYFKEREEIVESMALALLSRNHLVMIGGAGTSKSYLIKGFLAGLNDYKYFEWQLTKFSTPEEIFGMFSIAGLKADKYSRVTKGKLPECNIAYLDEIFNANSSILNSLNSSMNERVFEDQPIDLDSVFSATNFTPEDSVLVAFYDRFMFRHIVERIGDTNNFTSMLKASKFALNQRQLSKIEIKILQQKLSKITIPDVIVDIIAQLREDLVKEAIFPSDRRWKWSMDVLRARAMLYLRSEVQTDDLFCLKNVLWDDKKQIPIVEQTINKLIAPVMAKIKESVESVNEIIRNCKNADPKNPKELPLVIEGLEKLKLLVIEIDGILKQPNVTKKVKEMGLSAIKQIKESADAIRKDKLGYA